MKESLPKLKKILVVGSGGRENSLAWALRKCDGIEKVFVAPGNGGTKQHQGCQVIDVKESNAQELLKSCKSNQIDLVVIGPEAPLAEGIADFLREGGFAVFGPGADGAQLEASKAWAKALMEEARVPTAKHWVVEQEEAALSILGEIEKPLVVKADGLAAGKGVKVSDSVEETQRAIHEVFEGKFGCAGTRLVLEEKLSGPEISIFALCDGNQMVLLPPAQDHKRLEEGDKGPNTGGMGAYAPAVLIENDELNVIKDLILQPTLNALKARGIDYRGVIYAGLMLTESGPKVIEYNCRFGDPECQALMPLMGPQLAHVLQACALGCLMKAPKLDIKDRCSACVVAAASGYPAKPRKADLLDIKMKENNSLQLFHAGTSCNQEGTLFTSGGRVLAVVAQGENFDEAFKRAYEGMALVHFEGMVFRRDIGNQVRKP